MNKVYTLAVLAAVLSGCAVPATTWKGKVEWPDEHSAKNVVPLTEAGAALAAAGAIREMVRRNPYPDLFWGCSSPEQGLDVAVFTGPTPGLYYVVVDQRFDRCGNPRGAPVRVLDGWYAYAVTPQGEVVAEPPPPAHEDKASLPPPSPTPAEQTPPPAAPPTPTGAGAPVQSPPPAAPSPAAPAPTPPAPSDSLQGGTAPAAGTGTPGDAGTTADSTQVPPRVTLEVQDIHYNGWLLSVRVLMSPVAGSLRLDRNTTTVDIGPVSNCAGEKLVTYRMGYVRSPSVRPEEILILHPGSWYGSTRLFPLFGERYTGIGPECIETDIFLISEGKRVASQRIRAVRTLAQTSDGGVPQAPRPTADAGSP